MKLFNTTVISAILAPTLIHAIDVGVTFWDGPNGTGNKYTMTAHGGCDQLPDYMNDKARSVGIYPAGYRCDFWADKDCNNNGNQGGNCRTPSTTGYAPGPFTRQAGLSNFDNTCARVTTSFKCYQN